MMLFFLICYFLFGPALTQSAPLSGVLPIPSLDDERNTYRSWGWTWTADKEPNFLGDPTYSVSSPDIHSDTEGDDLWNYIMMYRRTGQQGYLDRANAWARYFKQDYRACVGAEFENFCYDRDNFDMDHMYGWGLVEWYKYSGDIAALTEAENLAALLETYYSHPRYVPGQHNMAYYGLRGGARHLLLVTRVAEVTQKVRWINLRDKLIELWLRSPDWDSRGMYFVGDWQTDFVLGSGSYASGIRIQSAFQIGILTEAFYHAYRTTGRLELKDRMVAMARFIDQYGLDPNYQYTGSWFGVKNDAVFHRESSSSPVTFWDPVYTTSLVNTLVLGYKYTGDQRLYNRAKYFFNRGTKGVYGSPTQRVASDTEVHHFVDTIFDSSTENFYLAYNKGELQYTYLLFENGGLPSTDITPPSPPTGLRVE